LAELFHAFAWEFLVFPDVFEEMRPGLTRLTRELACLKTKPAL
jgi:hypothetical protein